MGYERPATLDQALAHLAKGGKTILAGGTDLYPSTTAACLSGDVLDISAIGELRGIERVPTGWRLGARTTWTDVINAELPASFDALKQAATEVGSVQIQNVGTIAGNLCNASPAADGVPPLMVLDADVELCSVRGRRTVPLGQFLTGVRKTARQDDEIATAIWVPDTAAIGHSLFAKLGARRHLVISITMVAIRVVLDKSTITDAAIAIGACSAVARRLPVIEELLRGAHACDVERLVAGEEIAEAIDPIDDVRSSAAYRADAAAVMVRRGLGALCSGAP